MKLKSFILLLTQVFILSAAQLNGVVRTFSLLEPTEKKAARTAVLIMAPTDMGSSFKESRWQLGKKVWEQYMNSHPNVDCYFLKTVYLRKDTSEQTWIEGDTIYVGDWVYEKQGIQRQVHRTVKAIEKLLPNYTHFVRTNLNTFWNLKELNEYAENHHQSMFTGPLWQNQWYVIGYGVLFSADVANHIVNEYRRLEEKPLVAYTIPEDAALGGLATGIFPYYDYIEGNNRFSCCPSLQFGVSQLMCLESFSTTRFSKYGLLLFPPPSFEETIECCKLVLNSALLYRIRSGFNLDKLAELYEFLLSSIYPELPKIDLVEYAKSFPTIYSDNT